MRGAVVLFVVTLSAAALAQPPDEAKTAAPVKIVPVHDKAGWVTVELPGGFYRYPAAKPGTDAKSEGGVTVVPAAESATSMRPRQPAELTGAPPPAPPSAPEATPAPAPSCEHERGLLNQRLWYLRGVVVDPASANVLADSETPLLPSADGFVPAFGPGTASNLASVVGDDLVARERLADYAKCLDEARR